WVVTILLGAQGAIGGATGYLAWVNLALGLFNLVPGFPLDGGRVLRALVWRATGSYARATQVATRLGRAVGFLLIALGVMALLGGDVGGLWIAAIGWFLTQAASASYFELQMQRVLRGVEAGDVMTRDLVTVPPDLALDVAVDRYFLRVDHSAFPVVGADGALLGLVRLAAVRKTSPADRGALRVADVMAPLDRVPLVGLHEPLDRVLERFQQDDVHRVVVVDAAGALLGMVTPRDVSRFLQRSTDLGLRR
ncbi:MAG TPA: CBS domain-containing protein, partial [Acidimicrobiales bacterium]|nr:CBS domain-containing protein [Acidimicrobiales bacterium]